MWLLATDIDREREVIQNSKEEGKGIARPSTQLEQGSRAAGAAGQRDLCAELC